MSEVCPECGQSGQTADDGRDEERAAVLKSLRAAAEFVDQIDVRTAAALRSEADYIERGEHRK